MFLQRPEPDPGRIFDNNVSRLDFIHLKSEGDNFTSSSNERKLDSFNQLKELGAVKMEVLSKMCLQSDDLFREPKKSAFDNVGSYVSNADTNPSPHCSPDESVPVKNLGYSLRPRKQNPIF